MGTSPYSNIVFKLENFISFCLSSLSTSRGEVSYLKSLRRRNNMYRRQNKIKKDGFEKNHYYAIIA